MGLPVAINDTMYDRGSFQFNFGLVIGQADFNKMHKRIMAEQILRKMAFYLTAMEEETFALSKGRHVNNFIPQTMQ